MTNLPTTTVDEPLAFARAHLVHLHRSSPWNLPASTPAEATAMVQETLRGMLSYAQGRLLLVAAARVGSTDAHAVLTTVILEAKSRGTLLPTELEAYAMELVAGLAPPHLRGPKKKDKMLRDIRIALTVAALIDRFGLDPTSRSARRRSACAVVAEALAVVHMGMGVKAVERIWQAYARAMPTVPRWTANLCLT
jgi:hypothetical protein